MNSDVLILFYVFYVQDDKLHLIAAIAAEQRRSEQNKPPLPRVATVRWQRLDPTLTLRAPPSQPPWCTSFNGWISFLLLYLDVWLQMLYKIVLHFEANKNIIWLHTEYNLISLCEIRGAWGHKVLFASTELDLFIILHEIASLWKF